MTYYCIIAVTGCADGQNGNNLQDATTDNIVDATTDTTADTGEADSSVDSATDTLPDILPDIVTDNGQSDGDTGSIELCNGIDDNNNGLIDENVTQSCGSDTGECTAGVRTCVNGVFGECQGEVTPQAETCNNLDDDCDGAIDNGFAPLQCGIGECATTAPACVNGQAGTCTPNTPQQEQCNSRDDDCNGLVDDLPPLTCRNGACITTISACINGLPNSCPVPNPNNEVCNGIDDDCDGMVDNGLGTTTCGTGVCSATVQNCINGVPQLCMPGRPTTEVCNGMDDDCNGTIDDVPPVVNRVGECAEQTTCVNGQLVTIGTFVAFGGLPTNSGTRTSPLNSISRAIANAQSIGAGADVCVCTTQGSNFVTVEDVTMVEGISVLGGFNCATWDIGTRSLVNFPTGIRNTDTDGLNFPAGITSATALDTMIVNGVHAMNPAVESSAITVTNASPRIVDVLATATAAQRSFGIRLIETTGNTARPQLSGGTFRGTPTTNGVGISIEGASAILRDVTAQVGDAGPTVRSSYGIQCRDCAGTTITNGSASGGISVGTSSGFYGTGDLSNVVVIGTNFDGGRSDLATHGVYLENCQGSPSFGLTANSTAATVWQGGNAVSGLSGSHNGFTATGTTCAPTVNGSPLTTIRGCETGQSCSAVVCDGSPCTVQNVSTLVGSVNGALQPYGVQCLNNGCQRIANNNIAAGNIANMGDHCAGVLLSPSRVSLDANNIRSCANRQFTSLILNAYYGVEVRGVGDPVITNNVIRDDLLAGPADPTTTLFGYFMASAGPTMGQATVHSNTLEYCSTGVSVCVNRIGLLLSGNPGMLSGPSGVFRNNLFARRNPGTNALAVSENNIASDPLVFENNNLSDPSPRIYLDEGSAVLASIAQVNALNGMGSSYARNISSDCSLDTTWHIGSGSACVGGGTAAGAPDHDFEGDRRPLLNNNYDIGADERATP